MLNYIHIPATDDKASDTSQADIDQLFTELSGKGIQDVTVYIHGGVNPYSYGRHQANVMQESLGSDGRHVVSMVWETGPVETLKSQLADLLGRPMIHKLTSYIHNRFRKSTPNSGQPGTLGSWGRDATPNEEDLLTTAIADNGEILTDAQLAELESLLTADFEKELEGDHQLISEIQQALAQNQGELTEEFVTDASRGAQPGTLGVFDNIKLSSFLGAISKRVAERVQNKRDHGQWATIVEEVFRSIYVADVVKASWDDMKKRACNMWENAQEESPFKPSLYFLQKLEAYQQANGAVKVNLLAHSAGSISVCHLLSMIERDCPDLSINHVVFTAPAVALKLFYEELVTKQTRFKQFTLFTMSDQQELEDAILPHVYPSSLLYLVSGILEDEVDEPISGMMRFLGGKSPFNGEMFAKTHTFLTDPSAERLVLSKHEPTRRRRLQAETTRHGDFDKDPLMLQSIRALLDGAEA